MFSSLQLSSHSDICIPQDLKMSLIIHVIMCQEVSGKPLNYLLDFVNLRHAHSHFSLLHIFFTYKEGYRNKKLHLLDDFLFRSSWCPVLLNRNFNLQFFPQCSSHSTSLKSFRKLKWGQCLRGIHIYFQDIFQIFLAVFNIDYTKIDICYIKI